jgi:hypothetical protein
MKKFNIYILVCLLLSSGVSAKTFTIVNSGKWSDVSIWQDGSVSNQIEEGDVVLVKSHIMINVDLIVKGTLIVDKGFSMMSNKSIFITKSGKFINDGNVSVKRLFNEGIINNNAMLESMLDIENKGILDNNVNMVAGSNLLNFGGNVKGRNGTYFANSSVVSSPSATFSKDINMFYGGETSTTTTTTTANTSMKLETEVVKNNIMLTVSNPNKETANNFSIERSFDGKNFETISEVKGSTDNVAMIFQDKNIENDLVHYKVKVNGGAYLPLATVRMPLSASASIQ